MGRLWRHKKYKQTTIRRYLTAACVSRRTHTDRRGRRQWGVGRDYFAANARATSKPTDGQTAQSTVAACILLYRARVPSDASARALPLSTYTHGYTCVRTPRRSFTFRRLRMDCYDFVGFFFKFLLGRVFVFVLRKRVSVKKKK